MSILSALEGVLLIPGLETTRQEILSVIAGVKGGWESCMGIWSFNAFVVFVLGGLGTCFNITVPIYSQGHKSILCDTVSCGKWHFRILRAFRGNPLCNRARGALNRYRTIGKEANYQGVVFCVWRPLIELSRSRCVSHQASRSKKWSFRDDIYAF